MEIAHEILYNKGTILIFCQNKVNMRTYHNHHETITVGIAHEILEYNKGTDNLILLGIKTRGEYLANRIQDKIHQIEQQRIPTGTIDITYFRDDIEHMSSLRQRRNRHRHRYYR